MTQTTPNTPRDMLRHCAEQALRHLDDPAADVATIARQQRDTARLVLSEIEAAPAGQPEPAHACGEWE